MERIVFDAYKTKDVIMKSLEVVKEFIISKKLILTGGMAIDLALKSVGHKGIYTEDELPDYDFFSPKFHVDAYELGQKLCQAGMPNVTVINALHVMTMRIRTDFDVVGDLTFMNPDIFNKIPYLTVNKMRIIHPHFIMATQFLSLSMPMDNYPREFIFHRGEKDLVRCNLLDEHFPVPKGKSPKMVSYKLKTEDNICLSGWTALSYWLGTSTIPENRHIEYISDHINEVDKSKIKKWYSGFLDIVPRSILVGEHRIFDGFGHKYAAHYDEKLKVYVVNLQFILCQFMCEYLFDPNEHTKYSYNVARDLLIKGIKENNKLLLPGIKSYGKSSVSGNFLVSAIRFLHDAEKLSDISKFQLPSMHAFEQCVIPEKLLQYNFQMCELFKNDYVETEPFIFFQDILNQI